ncbi:MAG: serine/threonine protein phosphatase [Oscillospiraceae bacterium]|nr:serine/threonine protein phosphatase [Oscillospiraceae bacterium]
MNLFKLFSSKKQKNQSSCTSVLSPSCSSPFSVFNTSISPQENKLYLSIRQSIPIIDAAILKIIHLVGGFSINTGDPNVDIFLNNLCDNIKVGPSSIGIESFISSYLDSILTYGHAIGEILISSDNKNVCGLINGDVNFIRVSPSSSPIDLNISVSSDNGMSFSHIKDKSLICFSALNPTSHNITGTSILNNLPFVSSILLKIYNTISKNFDRAANVRFAINYKPSSSTDPSTTSSRLSQISKEWSRSMDNSSSEIRDFITSGDIDIKVIGADAQLIDSSIPVRQMLEQIISKLSLPPFLLGLNWSTSERMSKQQADILTSELQYYRRLLTPIIYKISKTILSINGFHHNPSINWNNINLQDEIEFAKARFYNSKAIQLEQEIDKKENLK